MLWPRDAEVLGCHRGFHDGCRHCRWVVLIWNRKPGTSENAITGAFLHMGQCFWAMGKCCSVSVTAAHLELKWWADLQRLSGVFLTMVFTRSSHLHFCWRALPLPHTKVGMRETEITMKTAIPIQTLLAVSHNQIQNYFLTKRDNNSVFLCMILCLPLLWQTLNECPHKRSSLLHPGSRGDNHCSPFLMPS